MPRADELEYGDRILHPAYHPDDSVIVTVVRVRNMLSKTKVTFRAHGMQGQFECPPHKELTEVP